MPHEIIINSPSGENLTDLQRSTSAVEKRQDYKTKSTPPSLEYKPKSNAPCLEFSVLKPTPKIVEPKDVVEKGEEIVEDKEKVENNETVTDNAEDIDKAVVKEEEKTKVVEDLDSGVEPLNDEMTSETIYERTSQSPERLLDSSTDSVPPSESSMESSQTCTSSLESSSHSPPLEESSLSSERDREPVKKERHVGFSGVDSDKETEGNQSYICKIVGGVVQKIPVDSKGSPSHSPAVIRRPKTGRRKIDRRVSCKDLGKGDCEGWLHKRKAKGGGPLSSHWQKRWCVIKDYNMFCYHDKESLKAEVVIHLPAFKVSPADSTDFKTKKHAFKIHNSGTCFYFASERQEDMSKWMNKMGLAAITFSEKFKKPELGKYDKNHQDSEDYSESDEDKPSRDPSPDIGNSQEDLSVMIRKQSQRGQNLFGEDLNKQRRSALSKELVDKVSPEVIKFKKVKCLERTLKAKEKELEELDAILSEISPEKLHMYQALHTNPGETDSE